MSTYNKWLISLLIVALAAGLLIVGPRRALWNRWITLAAALALLIALPNLVYQATHSWPQLTMSRALSKDTAGTVRIVMWPYLFLLLGPPLVPIWVAGLVALWRRPAWRAVRFLPLAFAVLLLETFADGGQLYYPFGLLAVVYAAGCVPAADFLARSRGWRCRSCPAAGVNDNGRRFLQELPTRRRKDYARVCSSMCATRRQSGRAGVKGLCRLAVAAAGQKLGAA
ncbi:MAG: hypothetical protein ACLPUO_15855 [Streptosporangiaceae bacterium]